jgi:hypothetical protein
MKLEIESTEEVGEIILEDGHCVPCRIWKGTTPGGGTCLLFVTRIAVLAEDTAEFWSTLEDMTPTTKTRTQ